MPQNRQQTARFKVINECLSRPGSYWTKQQLLNKISEIDIDIKDRSIEGDLHLMRHCQQLKYYAPIEYCKRNKGYHYTDSDYSIDKLPLNQADIVALELAATTLKQYQYIPIMKEFTAIIDKIIRVVNRAKQSDHESILDFIEFEKTPVALGLEHMDIIIDAIQKKKPLNLSYQSFSSDIPTLQIVHPYFLKEYRNRWYVIGLNESKKAIRTYGFDRIKSVTFSTNSRYIPNTLINTKEYLGNCVGVDLKDGNVEIVRLLFTPNQGHYLKTQALHKSQMIIEDCPKNGLLLEYRLVVNYELTGIILSYGADVKVLAPKSLKDKILEISDRIKVRNR
ncbi:YafY family protein [Pedobacter sp. MC2016-24]|uniref:helix-turn-helix transcriptional regulator n=1 Tax=Pedobacter sp. MC2016-24 TaxID=2780090 RepID=UPI001881A632|nr:WYL domain-containing protein [Pedobacter sp. MC2016-24]MBE9598000.1 WYL domain-containing protein [Pedobacter sp. MC2016-24]